MTPEQIREALTERRGAFHTESDRVVREAATSYADVLERFILVDKDAPSIDWTPATRNALTRRGASFLMVGRPDGVYRLTEPAEEVQP